MVEFEFKNEYNINDLIHIVELLRSKDGCPWDKEQTHLSIRMDFIEEVYETVEAIDFDSVPMLREELGDVLLQVIFHTQIEREKENFDFDDVVDEISKKLIVRHPHVFGDVNVSSTDDVLKNWDSIKKKTKGQENYTETLKSVPKVFPSLLRAEKLVKRAKRAGYDFYSKKGLIEQINLSLNSLSEKDNISSSQIGEILFKVTYLSKQLGINAEEALKEYNDSFIKHFEKTEQDAISNGQATTDLEKSDWEKYL